jgi:sirohydrochlorin ferrochelatase
VEPRALATANRDIGVVIVDHGSRGANANLLHEQFVAKWRDLSRYDIVEAAHMEFAQPSIGMAFDSCVAAGAISVAILPLFLWPGAHVERDIPTLVAQAAARHPGVAFAVGPPLGAHPLLSQIVDDHLARVTERLETHARDMTHKSDAAGAVRDEDPRQSVS